MIDIRIHDARWTTIDPLTVARTDYIIGTGRPITQNKIDRIRESINQIGLIPNTVEAILRSDGKVEIIDGRALWMAIENWWGSGDPRQYLGVLIAPEGVSEAHITIMLNRAQQQLPLTQAIRRWANEGLSEYVRLRTLMNLYPSVPPGQIALCLCTAFTTVQGGLSREIENGRFVANNPVRGELQVEFLDHLFSDLRNQNRYQSLTADGFIVAGRQRWVAGTFLIDYTGAPGRTRRAPTAPNAALILPNPTSPQPRVTTRGTIRYTLIHDQVVQDDINFPRIPFHRARGTRGRLDRTAWNNSILDRMGIPPAPAPATTASHP